MISKQFSQEEVLLVVMRMNLKTFTTSLRAQVLYSQNHSLVQLNPNLLLTDPMKPKSLNMMLEPIPYSRETVNPPKNRMKIKKKIPKIIMMMGDCSVVVSLVIIAYLEDQLLVLQTTKIT